MWQYCVLIVVLVFAVGYAGWRFYDAVRKGGDPCCNCELKKNCKKFGSVKDNSYLCTRK